MKDFLKVAAVVVVCQLVGVLLYYCQNESGGRSAMEGATKEVRDTVVVHDTMPYIAPAAVKSVVAGRREVIVPVVAAVGAEEIEGPRIRADSAAWVYAAEDIEAGRDSMKIELPIVQNIYESEDYKAYVSGFEPRLDSIFVYPRREVVTIRKPPERWHIGPVAGYGYTPGGWRPFIGVGVSYSVFSF